MNKNKKHLKNRPTQIYPFFLLLLLISLLSLQVSLSPCSYASEDAVPAFQNDTLSNYTHVHDTANLTFLVDPKLYTKTSYGALFKIENLLYPAQKTDVELNYLVFEADDYANNPELFALQNLIINQTLIIKDINKYKSSGTGELYFDIPGDYVLCASLNTSSSFASPEYGIMQISLVSYSCKNLSVLDISILDCDDSLTLSLTGQDIKEAIPIDNSSEPIIPSKISEPIIYSLNESLKFELETNSTTPHTIEFWITDVFGNVIREPLNSTSLRKQFTPKFDELMNLYFVNALLHNQCNDSDISNNYIQREFIFVNNQTPDTKPHLDLTFASNTTDIFFGDSLRIKIRFNKGDSAKNLIEAFVADADGKKLSETTKVSDFGASFERELSFYVDLNRECSSKPPFSLVVQGFDMRDSTLISINCKEPAQPDLKEGKNATKPITTPAKAPSQKTSSKPQTRSALSTTQPYSSLDNKSSSTNESMFLSSSQQDQPLSSINSRNALNSEYTKQYLNTTLIYQGTQSKINSYMWLFLGVLLALNIIALLYMKS